MKEPALTPVLVTGGYGFMGSHFVRYLYQNHPNYKIVNLDLLTYAGNTDNLLDIETLEATVPEAHKRYVFVKGDICNQPFVDELFRKYNFKIVFHFAAETHVDRSLTSVTDFIRTNIEGTRVILELVRKAQVPHMVHISTDEIYGNVENGFSTESAPLNPSNPYSVSKAAGDMLARTYATVYGIPVSVVRSGNNYGAFQYPEKLIPLVITNLLEGRDIPIHGSGKHMRSWVHVNDFSSAVDAIAHSPHAPSVYNIAGEHKSNLEVIGLVAKHLGIAHDPFLKHVNDRPNADLRYAPHGQKIVEKLHWGRQHDIESVLPEVIDWYRTNDSWWQNIKAKKEFAEQYDRQSKAQWY